MDETIFLPDGRDARGTLDAAAADARRCVVACPPHPQHGGHRGDQRLRAVSEALNARGVDCLRFDYGAWDGGRGERTDALAGVQWARERYDRVGLFGFSFGGAVALSAGARGADVDAVSALAPPARVGTARADFGAESGPVGADDSGDASDAGDSGDANDAGDPAVGDAEIGGIDAVADLGSIPEEIPVQVLYGTRDDVADVGPVVALARERGDAVVEFAADHFFVGQESKVATAVADFVTPALGSPE
ncbi:alpha/beta hydrolase [Halobellus sp. GM3]|uniref:alpha/beta hydrolase n=1 Tax=Halobellus sp. GM3 TaxID=3458410 RepID=UPI00403DF183